MMLDGKSGWLNESADIGSLPRLSAAITTPSLNLTPNTEVPVTAGDCVWV
jgi:hypothetical protein